MCEFPLRSEADLIRRDMMLEIPVVPVRIEFILAEELARLIKSVVFMPPSPEEAEE